MNKTAKLKLALERGLTPCKKCGRNQGWTLRRSCRVGDVPTLVLCKCRVIPHDGIRPPVYQVV